MHNDNIDIDYIKNIIREEGGHVSISPSNYPVTLIFTKVLTPLTCVEDGVTITTTENYAKYNVEAATMRVKDIEEFKVNIRALLEYRSYAIIWISSVRLIDDYICIRLGYLTEFYGEQRELTRDEAIEMVNNPPKSVSDTYIQDLKAVYGL